MITSLSKKAALRRSATYKVGAGLGVLLFNFVLISTMGWTLGSSLNTLDNVILLIFMLVPILVVWGSMDYMASKGYAKITGWLVLFGLVGAIVMFALRDQNRVC